MMAPYEGEDGGAVGGGGGAVGGGGVGVAPTTYYRTSLCTLPNPLQTFARRIRNRKRPPDPAEKR